MELKCIEIACGMIGEDVLPTKLDEKLREINELVGLYGDGGQLYSRQVIGLIVWQWQNEQSNKQAIRDIPDH